MTTPTKWVSPHRQGAMELNPDMVQKIDDEIEFELDTMPDTEIVRHWMFSDVSYRKALADLIVASVIGYSVHLGAPVTGHPTTLAWLQKVQARPSMQIDA